MAMDEDIKQAAQWILEALERNQEERRSWHDEQMNRYVDNMDNAKAGHRAMITMAWIRLLAEVMIVVMMILIYWRL